MHIGSLFSEGRIFYIMLLLLLPMLAGCIVLLVQVRSQLKRYYATRNLNESGKQQPVQRNEKSS